MLEVQGDVAELLLDVTDDFSLGGGGEAVASLCEDLHEVVCEIATGKIQTKDGMGKGVTLIDGHGVGYTITRVHNDTCGTARGVQRQHSLDGYVHGGGVEGLEHDLCHLLSVGFGVEGSLGEENGVLFWGDSQLVVEGMMPDLLHVVPVCDDAVLDGVFQGKDTSLALSLISHIAVFLAHTNHDALKKKKEYVYLSHDWQNSRLLIGQLAYDMKLY